MWILKSRQAGLRLARGTPLAQGGTIHPTHRKTLGHITTTRRKLIGKKGDAWIKKELANSINKLASLRNSSPEAISRYLSVKVPGTTQKSMAKKIIIIETLIDSSKVVLNRG